MAYLLLSLFTLFSNLYALIVYVRLFHVQSLNLLLQFLQSHGQITRTHSFLWQIFAKFCGPVCKIPRQDCLNFAAYHGRPFVNEMSSILCINFGYRRLALCSVMLATFLKNYQFFFSFQKCNLSSRVVFIYYCVSYSDGYRSFWQVSLIFSVI